jgi:hypothetical protein
MANRILNHILQFCDITVKRAVPLAIALLNVKQLSSGKDNFYLDIKPENSANGLASEVGA